MKHPQKLNWLKLLLLPAAISSLSVFSTQAVAVNALHNRVLDTRAADLAQETAKPESAVVAAKSGKASPILVVEGHFAGSEELPDFKTQTLKPIDGALEVELSNSDLMVMSTAEADAEPEQMVDSDELMSDEAFEAEVAESDAAEMEVTETEEPADGDAFNFGDQPEVSEGSDPLRFINKPINSFNSALDKAVLKPTAKVYQKVTPAPVKSGVRNFFKNLREPWTAVNLMLQGKPADSAKSLGRFTLNTVTSLGFVDVSAKYQGLSIPKEDLGQTLAVWGVPNGPYMVLPLLGPSTLRDTAGLPFDSAAYPPAYLQDDATMIGVTAADGISLRAELLSIDGLVDPYDYELLKSVYLQNRAYEISRSGSAPSAEQETFSSEGFGD
jgi:phospholipid-binding lipoprotein MlaA